MPRVTVLCGRIAGAGCALARQLAVGGEWVVLTCDELEQANYDEILRLPPGCSSSRYREQLIGMAAELHRIGVNVMLDLFLPDAASRRYVMDRLREEGMEADMVYACGADEPLDAFLRARADRANKTRNPFLASDAATVRRFNARFCPPDGSEGCTVWGAPAV